MSIVQSRLFSRVTDPRETESAVAIVQADVNAFLATLPFADVGDVRRGVQPIGKYGEMLLVWSEVLYLETT